MAIDSSLKKEDLEERLHNAAENVVDILVKFGHSPREIILSNGKEHIYLFKNLLEQELSDKKYDIPVIIDNEKQGYVIEVESYLKMFIG